MDSENSVAAWAAPIDVAKAQQRGELSPMRNPEMIFTIIHGAFWYRLLNRGTLDAKFAQDLTSEVFS
ncbi:TetR-like C-terminal domain-containing protein [Rhodobacteraceae bacterium KMM 6894]|nr:TetR-like C-terminal domain-containing protein [Rhodobacteraceae bacterium KMM 6894]